MKKLSKKWIVPIVIIGIFILFNLIWVITVNIKYARYTKSVPKNEFGIHGITDDEGYSYNVKKPDYLQFTGNLGVTSDSGNSLIIWPKITGGYEYGVILCIDDVMYQITIDDNMQTNENDDYIKELVKDNQDTIKLLFEKAESMWKL